SDHGDELEWWDGVWVVQSTWTGNGPIAANTPVKYAVPRDNVGRFKLSVMVQAHGGIAAGDRQGDDARRACHLPRFRAMRMRAGTRGPHERPGAVPRSDELLSEPDGRSPHAATRQRPLRSAECRAQADRDSPLHVPRDGGGGDRPRRAPPEGVPGVLPGEFL